MGIKIVSTVFEEGNMIPKKYTSDGADISPSLSWDLTSEAVESFAIMCEDPDAPMGTWTHWIIFNIPSDIRKLSGNIGNLGTLENGAKQGLNDFGSIGYGGPSPPSGETHRYYFKIYALDVKLDLDAGARKEELLVSMEGHILDIGQIMGIYGR